MVAHRFGIRRDGCRYLNAGQVAGRIDIRLIEATEVALLDVSAFLIS